LRKNNNFTILAIDTSCDETSVAVTQDDRVLANIVASQIGDLIVTLKAVQSVHSINIRTIQKLKALKQGLGFSTTIDSHDAFIRSVVGRELFSNIRPANPGHASSAPFERSKSFLNKTQV